MAADEMTLTKTIARYGRVDLLCTDELGYMELDRRGWWDENGRLAPWPEDVFLPDGTINPPLAAQGRRSHQPGHRPRSRRPDVLGPDLRMP